MIRFIVAPLMNTLYILEKQEFILISNLILLTLSITSFIVGKILSLSFEHTLIIYTIVMTLAYLIMFAIIWAIVHSKNTKSQKA